MLNFILRQWESWCSIILASFWADMVRRGNNLLLNGLSIKRFTSMTKILYRFILQTMTLLAVKTTREHGLQSLPRLKKNWRKKRNIQLHYLSANNLRLFFQINKNYTHFSVMIEMAENSIYSDKVMCWALLIELAILCELTGLFMYGALITKIL